MKSNTLKNFKTFLISSLILIMVNACSKENTEMMNDNDANSDQDMDTEIIVEDLSCNST